MSRYEAIMQMSVDEMAEKLSVMCKNAETCYGCVFEDDCPSSEAFLAWKEWLNEQRETD